MGYRTYSLAQTFSVPTTASSLTTAYSAGDLIANSSLAASVVPLQWTVGTNFMLNTVSITSNSTVNTNAKFLLQLYGSSPTASNGDNGVWLTTSSNYLERVLVDCTVNNFSAGFAGTGVYANTTLASSIPMPLPVPYTTVYGLLTAAASWTASSTTSLTVTLTGGMDM